MNQEYEKLETLLRELFQLDQPDLGTHPQAGPLRIDRNARYWTVGAHGWVVSSRPPWALLYTITAAAGASGRLTGRPSAMSSRPLN